MVSARTIRKIGYGWRRYFMYPANQHNEEERKERVRLWNDIEPPARPDFPGDPRDWENALWTRISEPVGEKNARFGSVVKKRSASPLLSSSG